jgi:hypothetical protein
VGYCHPLSDECKKLGIMDNLCGVCTGLPGGGFQLKEDKAGLRFSGIYIYIYIYVYVYIYM